MIVPEILISDRGTHFESQLFKEMTQKLGIEKRRVTAFHPSANGGVERQHRRLKEALRAKSEVAPREWLANLPLVLLGLRNSISKDTGASAAQSVFGRQLSVPGCIFEGSFNVEDIKDSHRSFTRKDCHVPEALKTCTHVWLRKHGRILSLSRPYYGPFPVVTRNFDNHTMVLLTNNREETVTMERVKPAFGVDDISGSSILNDTKPHRVTFCEQIPEISL